MNARSSRHVVFVVALVSAGALVRGQVSGPDPLTVRDSTGSMLDATSSCSLIRGGVRPDAKAQDKIVADVLTDAQRKQLEAGRGGAPHPVPPGMMGGK